MRIIQPNEFIREYSTESENSVAFLRAANVEDGRLNLDNVVFVDSAKVDKAKDSFIESGDVLITRTGAKAGATCVVPELTRKFCISSHSIRVVPRRDRIEPKFLEAFLLSRWGKSQINRLFTGAAQKQLQLASVAGIEIVVPPYELQENLVAEMEAARKARDKTLAQAELLLSGLDGYLLEQLGLTPPEEKERYVFAVRLGEIRNSRLDAANATGLKAQKARPIYNEVALAKIAEVIMGQAPDGDEYNNDGMGLPLIAGAADLGESTPKPKKWTTSAPKQCRPGDIILCVRATIGDLNWADRTYCLGRGVAGIRPNSGVVPEFLYEMLYLRRSYLQARGTGSTFRQVVSAEVNACPIPLPPLDVQQAIADEVQRRRLEARRLRQEAAESWAAAKARFERRLLEEEA